MSDKSQWFCDFSFIRVHKPVSQTVQVTKAFLKSAAVKTGSGGLTNAGPPQAQMDQEL